ncbi:hypothetical protein CL684_03050 [Candidatus Campbellbacteria bacterium]|nr:hypothetical protein [Candidatus Campbellbacteria bacterium]
MKKLLLPITIIILIVIAILLSNKNNLEQVTSPGLAGIAEAEQRCYEYRSETEAGENVERIDVTVKGQEVYGTHSITPANGESEYATIAGATADGYFNVIASANRGDYSWREQRVYQVIDDRLYVGYQRVEVPRVEDEGVFMYADLKELAFETDEFYLEEIDCNLAL